MLKKYALSIPFDKPSKSNDHVCLQEGTDEYVLMEFVANLDTSILTVTFKSQDADLANRVCTTFSAAFLTSMHG